MGKEDRVHLPTTFEVEQAKESSRKLSKYMNVDHITLSVSSSDGEEDGEKDEFIMPRHTLQLLLNVLSEISKGNAVSLVPHHQDLSTQEAANIVNVSRPFFVKLLKNNVIPFRTIGSHRRVLLRDVITYKHDIDRNRMTVLDELTKFSQEEGLGY